MYNAWSSPLDQEDMHRVCGPSIVLAYDRTNQFPISDLRSRPVSAMAYKISQTRKFNSFPLLETLPLLEGSTFSLISHLSGMSHFSLILLTKACHYFGNYHEFLHILSSLECDSKLKGHTALG